MTLLWTDCIGAGATGAALLALRRPLSVVYQLPQRAIVLHACVHLAYGAYSGRLARAHHRSQTDVRRLAIANLGWGAVCLGLASARSGSHLWRAAMVLEGLYVGGLGAAEFALRRRLATRP
jgi:hypothetical protein